MTLTVLLVETFVIAFLLKRSSESAPFLIAAITLLTLAVSAGMFNIYLYRKALSAHNREQNIKSLKNFFSRK